MSGSFPSLMTMVIALWLDRPTVRGRSGSQLCRSTCGVGWLRVCGRPQHGLAPFRDVERFSCPCPQGRPFFCYEPKANGPLRREPYAPARRQSADSPLNIRLARLVTPRGQTQMSADIPRLSEPFRLVDRRSERECCDRTDTWRAHQSSANRFVPDYDEHLFGQLCKLAQHRGENFEQRLDHPHQGFLSGSQLTSPKNEILSCRSSKFQAGFA